jgi:hypothetical protein
MLKRILVIAAMLLVVLLSSHAFATPITFIDTTSFSSGGTDAQEDLVAYGGVYVDELEGCGDFVSWKHQFTLVPAPQEILKGTLEIFLADDSDWCWEWGFLFAEDGTWGVGEVGTGDYRLGIDVASLVDGEFMVTIASLCGDFFIRESELTICYEPVPEPGTLVLLGAGLIGLGYICRRKKV